VKLKHTAYLLIIGCLAACGSLSTGERLGGRFTAIFPTNTTVPPAASDNVSGDAERGAEIFRRKISEDIPACSSCHTSGFIRGAVLAPGLTGIRDRAATRVPGLSVEEYLRASILTPHVYIVEGYSDDMFAKYAEVLTEQEIEDLIAYLKTL
jgi:mono/diheme cytochrome c family protein